MPEIITNEARFQAARSAVLSESVAWEGIGTLSERSLHKILKLYVEPDTSRHEVSYMGSIVDVKCDDRIYEVQTKAYERLVPKLRRILPESPVTVVCPLASEKYTRWLDYTTGEMKSAGKVRSAKTYTMHSVCSSAYARSSRTKISRYVLYICR